MKKTIIIFSSLIFFSIYSYSQSKGYVAISVGPSIPIGDFASKNMANPSAGLSNTGAIFDISFAYKLGTQFGISALLRGQANPTDAQLIANELAKEDPLTYWTVESKTWGVGGLLFGGYGSFPVSEKINFDARGLIGFVNASSPEINITGTKQGKSIWAKQGIVSTNAFSYLIGAGFTFDIGSKICLMINMDYMGTKPEFNNIEIISSIGHKNTLSMKQNIETLNIGFGIGLKI